MFYFLQTILQNVYHAVWSDGFEDRDPGAEPRGTEGGGETGDGYVAEVEESVQTFLLERGRAESGDIYGNLGGF